MDLLDLTLSSDDEVPLQPSTSRSLHPTSTSHPSVRLKSGSNTSQGINSGARGSKARPSGRGSVNEHSSTPAGSSRTQTTDNRKGNQRVDIELSSDDDDDHFGGANSSATRRPLPRAQNGRLSAQSVTEIILPSDTESDSDAPTPLHRAPRWSSSSARHQPPASKNELEQTRGTARRASKTSSAGTALDNHAAKTSSASLRSPELQRDPTSINRGEDEGAGGRFKGGGAASASRAATSNLSPSVERHSGSPAPEASTSAAATILPQVTPSPKAAPHGVATAFTVKSGKGKEKAINQDEAVAHEDVGLPSVQLSVRTPFSPRGMSSSAEATGSPTIPPLLSPVDPPAHFPSLQARQFPSAPTTRCSPSSKPTAICRPAESAAISTTAKDADPPPQSDSHLGSHAARSSPNLSATAKLPSAPLAPNPRPSAEQPANSSSSLSGSLQAQPPPTTNSAPEILVLSSSSERGDSDLDSGSDSDIEIISPPAPLSRRDVAEESRLEWKGREERDLKRSEREAAELRGQVEMRQAKEETETRQLGAPTREEESIREEHGRAERERAKQEALREKMRETEEGQSLDRERASERERTEAERAEGERTEAERSEREKLDNEQLGRGQKLEGERRLRLTEDRESEAERARAAAEAYRKQRTEQDAEEEDRRRRAREEEDRVRQEQDREEEEELDRFCQVELPRLETETQKFRSTLREPVKEKWDEVLGHIIASEGVSTTKEYEERVERAKLALADVFEPERWSDEQCEPSLPEGQAQKVEGTAREGLTQDFEMDFVSETSGSAPMPSAESFPASSDPVHTLPKQHPGAGVDGVSAFDHKSSKEENAATRPAGRRLGLSAGEADEGSSSQQARGDNLASGDSEKTTARGSTLPAVSDSEPDAQHARSTSFARVAIVARLDRAGPSPAHRSTDFESQPDKIPGELASSEPNLYAGGELSLQDRREPEVSTGHLSILPAKKKKKRDKSSYPLKTARKSTGGQPIHLVRDPRRAVKSANGHRILSLPLADQQTARESRSPSSDPLVLDKIPSTKRPVTETDRHRLRKKIRLSGASVVKENPLPGGSGTSTPESITDELKTTLSVGTRGEDNFHREIEAPLIVGNAVAVISGADSVTKEITEERFKQDQFNKSRPYHRQIAGPSYDRDDEFPKMIQASVQRRERAWKERHPTGNPPLRDSYKGLYEQMISDANSSEYPPDHRPSIRIIPLGDAKNTDYSSPEFELCYTNRVIYADGIVPDQAPGCACIGDCGSPQNRAGCACRARQIAASKTRVNGGQRSGLQNFAYDSNGLLDEKIFNSDDPIIECNSQCGCSDDCINRVVGNKKSISVDIFRTLDKGWGIRNPHSYSDVSAYVERTIRKGEPLGIYAGELITHEEAEMRDKLIYSKTHRCYTYCLDAWPVGEDYKALAPKADADKMKVSSTKSSHKVAPRPIPTAKKSRSTNSQQRDSKRAVLRDEEDGDSDDDSFSGIYNVDAFSYGNWTRFANHVCVDYNMVPRCVYVDEINVTRPLWTYVARRDIKPGEELTISYFSGEEPRLYGKMDLKTWKKMADELRREQPKNFRCYCGKDLCRGVMFGTGKAEFYDPPE